MDAVDFGLLTDLFAENGLTADKKIMAVVVKPSLSADALARVTGFFSSGVADVSDLNDEDTSPQTYDAIVSGAAGDIVPCDVHLLSVYAKMLVPGGTLIVKTRSDDREKLAKLLKLCGFLDVVVGDGSPAATVVGRMAAYKVGSSDTITLNADVKSNVISAWKMDDDDSETIAEDDLLEADDLIKPDATALKVCATTKKAKACKNCSCGLAEELEASRLKQASKPDTSVAKSSCGSCYLGDAFRCASCPYLGMPAFKPGEKVQLAGNLLQDDF